MSVKLKIGASSELVEFITLGELAELSGKSKYSLLKLIERGIMPDANFRTPDKQVKHSADPNRVIRGNRLYSSEVIVPSLSAYLRDNIMQGKKITYEQQVELMNIFQLEREHFKLD